MRAWQDGRWMGAALVLGCALALAGCSSGVRSQVDTGPHYGTAIALPPSLPTDPDPCVKYCKQWVDPTYRMQPELVCTCPGTTKTFQETVYEMRAREVCVKPRSQRKVERCGDSCEQELVQIKPGGYRWMADEDCNCYQYCEQAPEYKWCNKRVDESGIRYCVEDPPEFKTVVDTVPVQRSRTVYIPPKYEIQYRKRVFQPGHHEWVGTQNPGCGVDCRKWSKPFKGSALDCGCPSVN